MTLIISRTAAPVGAVITPTVSGYCGMGFLNSSLKSPSSDRRFFICSNAIYKSPTPSGIISLIYS